MQKSAISWTTLSWNPISGCSRVSDGCKYCYAATLSARRGWTTKPWTIQNEADNVVMKPHKLKEPYLLKEPARIFTNSMSDMFHGVLPDWYIAAMFCVMLHNPQHTFQVLTKRPERTVDWHERFLAAQDDPAFIQFREDVKDKRVKAALSIHWPSPWTDHIWMGTSVEDARVLSRIDSLRASKAHVRFISAEPLIGPLGQVDFSGIHWVIVGGESGSHMTPDNPRWMKQEWAREIKEQCVAQGVAFFYKQDSGLVTEQRTYLVEADGTRWKWEQYPGDLKPAVCLDKRFAGYEGVTLDPDWGNAAVLPVVEQTVAEQPIIEFAVPAAELVNFQSIKAHWDSKTDQWDDSRFVYIGRANLGYHLPHSPWANPYRIDRDTPENRAAAIANYRSHIQNLVAQGRVRIDDLVGKTLVCWCSPQACHGDVLIDLLEAAGYPVVRVQQKQENKPQPTQQLVLFDLPVMSPQRRHFD